MKMKDKLIATGNGLAALAARHKAAPRSRVQTQSMMTTSRYSLKQRVRNNVKKY